MRSRLQIERDDCDACDEKIVSLMELFHKAYVRIIELEGKTTLSEEMSIMLYGDNEVEDEQKRSSPQYSCGPYVLAHSIHFEASSDNAREK